MVKSLYSPELGALLEILRARRQSAGISQHELAKRLGRSQSYVTKVETGERKLEVVEYLAWCRALGLPASGLLDEVEAAKSLIKD
ncbi:helix-turn-helix domain-containing protein [Sphingobium subterraneum]|uniref:Transcriptional regulator with XRE-family HTH domain n=1 Tax=Sphingobium subterraneum TaxID=627688 RepID=A0A841J1L4_9SPHN|nr:helix-turn-helix transcriptional regulator [Sphingobium subterraneum]MBB6124594.1 transcriptional regulator with XRE-family HTH domain [Sphingobium subterraneum]